MTQYHLPAETPSSPVTTGGECLHWQNCTLTAAVAETLTFYLSATKICSSSGILYAVTVWLTR